MRDAVKEAGLQTPVLTNRNDIGGYRTRISKHIIVTSKAYNHRFVVDVAGIGRRKKLLPGEVSLLKSMEKSAEVIVANETSRHLNRRKAEVSRKKGEGLNVKTFQIRNGGLPAIP